MIEQVGSAVAGIRDTLAPLAAGGPGPRPELFDHIPAGDVERHQVRHRLAAGEDAEFVAELGGDLIAGGVAVEMVDRTPAQLG